MRCCLLAVDFITQTSIRKQLPEAKLIICSGRKTHCSIDYREIRNGMVYLCSISHFKQVITRSQITIALIFCSRGYFGYDGSGTKYKRLLKAKTIPSIVMQLYGNVVKHEGILPSAQPTINIEIFRDCMEVRNV